MRVHTHACVLVQKGGGSGGRGREAQTASHLDSSHPELATFPMVGMSVKTQATAIIV